MNRVVAVLLLALLVRWCPSTAAENTRVEDGLQPAERPASAPTTEEPVPIEPLVARLKDKDPAIRRCAAETLGDLGDTRAVMPLIGCLEDKDAEVRGVAALALGALGDPRAVEPVIARLKDPHWYVRRQSAKALGQLADSRAAEALGISLKDESACVRPAAATSLTQLGDARALEPLLASLKDEDWDVRHDTADLLSRVRDARTVPVLITCLKDEDQEIHWLAIGTLGELGNAAVEPLIACLKDERGYVRCGAARVLGILGDMRAMEPLTACLKDPDQDVHETAVSSLARLAEAQEDQKPAGQNTMLRDRPTLDMVGGGEDSERRSTTPATGPESCRIAGYVCKSIEVPGGVDLPGADWVVKAEVEYPRFIHPAAVIEEQLNGAIRRTVWAVCKEYGPANLELGGFEIYAYTERFVSLRFFTYWNTPAGGVPQSASYARNLRLGVPISTVELKDFFVRDSAFGDVLRSLLLKPLQDQVSEYSDSDRECPVTAEELVAGSLGEFNVSQSGFHFHWLSYQVGPWVFDTEILFTQLENMLSRETLATLGLTAKTPGSDSVQPAQGSARKESPHADLTSESAKDNNAVSHETAPPALKPEEIDPFLENGMQLLKQASADLNGDGTADYILVLERQKEKPDDPDITEGQRPLLILIRDAAGALKLVKRNDKIIRCSTCSNQGVDPFLGVEAGVKTCTVRHYSDESWRWWREYTFNYSRRDQTWQLVRADEGDYELDEPNSGARVYTPPKDYGKIDIADFDPESYLGQGQR